MSSPHQRIVVCCPAPCSRFQSQHFRFGELLPKTRLQSRYSWSVLKGRKAAIKPTEDCVPGYSVPGLARLKDSAIGAWLVSAFACSFDHHES